VSKVYPGVRALDDVSLEVEPGEVYALIGENGAGKSTLLNILSGVTVPDSGSIEIDGTAVRIRSPLDARVARVAMIHQELKHVPELTVAQNMFLGRSLKRLGGLIVDRGAQERRAGAVLADIDASVDPASPMRELTVAQRQMVEIGRALLEDASIIAMDEPTSSLTPREFERLVQLIEKLSARGVSIIYVSHKMSEIYRTCSRASVLRDGKSVGVLPIPATKENDIVARMVGRVLVATTHRSHCLEEVLLQATGLGRGRHVIDASLSVKRGEVVGISGLVGAGRTELMRLVAGIDRPETGSVAIGGQTVRPNDPRAAIRAGLGLLPEERAREGIVAGRSVTANIALPSLSAFSRWGLVMRKRLRHRAFGLMQDLRLRPLDIDRPIGTLSGGNQQKVIIGRWLAASTQVLLFDEPTRGIDVGAKAEIYALIERLAAEGRAIVVVSSEMAELMRVSDRVLVMRAGRIVADLPRDQISEARILAHAIPQNEQRISTVDT
jgi:ribose transport system ATP-binding protein